MLKRLNTMTYWQWLIMSACAIPILMVVFALVQQGTRLPFYDTWDGGYTVAYSALEGRLTLDSMLRFHNEHPILFTRLVYVLSALFASFDLSLVLSVNILLSLGCALLFLRLVALDFGEEVAWTAAVPIFILMFTLRAWHHWIVAFQNQFGFVVFFFILAVYILRTSSLSWRTLLMAAGCALCATFSLGSGILAWLPLTLVLIARGYRKPLHYGIWVICAVLTLLLYQHYAGAGASRPPLGDFLLNPQWVYALLLHIASPLAVFDIRYSNLPNVIIALVMTGTFGVALLLANSLLVFSHWRRRGEALAKVTLWAAIVAFSLLNMASVVYGRLGGQNQANVGVMLANRYVPLTFFFWTVLLVMLIHNLREWGRRGKQGGSRLGMILNSTALAAVLGLMLGAAQFTPHDLDLPREAFEDCHHRFVYFNQPVNCNREEIGAVRQRVWDERLLTLANRGLALYAMPSLDISLTINTQPQILQESSPPYTAFAYWREREIPTSILLTAPGLLRYPHVYLPPSHTQVVFQTDLYIPMETPDPEADGVRYVVRVLALNEQLLAEHEAIYDPSVTPGLVPFALDLTPYIGQTLMLELETDPLENTTADSATWIEPRLHFTR